MRDLRVRAGLAAVALLALAGVSAGCTPGGPHGGSAGSAARSAARPSASSAHSGPLTLVPAVPPARGKPPTTLAGFYAQRLTWAPCYNNFRCARLYVPFDYARPDGPAFSLPVIELPAAKPAQRIGPLVINPGGPGESGVQRTIEARTGWFAQAIRDQFDIVGFDPRGVGSSEPALRCDEKGQAGGTFFAMPATSAQLAADESFTKKHVQACTRSAGALLPYMGTQWAARDMDVLRAALGQSRLTYFGWSYGTVLGASYVQQFPQRVRAFVLDGALAPRRSGLDLAIAQTQGYSYTFGQFVRWCLGQRDCPLHGSVAQATQQVLRLIARASAHPLASSSPSGQQADGDTVRYAVTASMQLESWWPDLTEALSRALNAGDGSVLVTLAYGNPGGGDSNSGDVANAVQCIDNPWPRSIGAYQAAATRAAKASPLFRSEFVWDWLSCAYWPVPARQVLSGTTSGAAGGGVPPVLVLGELHDPQTPYAGAVALARWLHTGVLLSWNGVGHTSYLEGSSCIDNAVDAYLISLRTPPNGTACP
jgi:pimeloyl-ACP methyl ester carboxylesterase